MDVPEDVANEIDPSRLDRENLVVVFDLKAQLCGKVFADLGE